MTDNGDGEPAPGKHRGLCKPWKPGESGNPGGRPRGSRNKLHEEFVNELYADWCEHGAEVLKTVRETRPDVYVKIIASLLPRALGVDETNAIQVHHTIKRIILEEGASTPEPPKRRGVQGCRSFRLAEGQLAHPRPARLPRKEEASTTGEPLRFRRDRDK